MRFIIFLLIIFQISFLRCSNKNSSDEKNNIDGKQTISNLKKYRLNDEIKTKTKEEIKYPNCLIKTFNVGDYPESMVLTPDNKYLYVTNQESGSIMVIETINNTVIDNIKIRYHSTYAHKTTCENKIIMSPNGDKIYFAMTDDPYIYIMDIKNQKNEIYQKEKYSAPHCPDKNIDYIS